MVRRFPVQVICRMPGVPVDRMDDFQRWGTDMILGAYDEDAAAAAAAAMTEVLEPIVEDRRQNVRNDLISRLLTYALLTVVTAAIAALSIRTAWALLRETFLPRGSIAPVARSPGP